MDDTEWTPEQESAAKRLAVVMAIAALAFGLVIVALIAAFVATH